MKVKKIGETQEPEETEINIEEPDTVIQENIIHTEKNESNKTKYYMIGGFLIIIIAALLYYIFVFQKSNNNAEVNSVRSNTGVTQVPPQNNYNDKTELTKEEVTGFINKWASHQNNKQISDYVALYDPSFNGIKRTKTGKSYYLNYAEWIADRSNMYQKAKYVTVQCNNLSVKLLTDNTAEATFNQIYLSDSYNDEGTKILKLKKNNDGKLVITNEELIYSISKDN